MTIRLAESRDIPGLINLLHQVGGVHHDIRPDLFRENAIKYTPAQLEELLRDKDCPIFIYEDGGLTGYCFCQIRHYAGSTVMTDRAELYIDDLCVDETKRGQGIAKALYAHVCAYAKDIGCGYVTLNVWRGNEGAMKFYEKAGMAKRSITMEAKLC